MAKTRLVDLFMAELIRYGSDVKTRLQVLKEIQAMEFEGGEKEKSACIDVFVYWAKPVREPKGPEGEGEREADSN